MLFLSYLRFLLTVGFGVLLTATVLHAQPAPTNYSSVILSRVLHTCPNVPVRVAKRIHSAVLEAEARHNTDATLLLAIIDQESTCRPAIRGAAGEIGLMQLLPLHTRERGLQRTDLLDAATNISIGAEYLAEQIAEFRSTQLALTAYNRGPGATRRAGTPNTYSAQVLQRYAKLQDIK